MDYNVKIVVSIRADNFFSFATGSNMASSVLYECSTCEAMFKTEDRLLTHRRESRCTATGRRISLSSSPSTSSSVTSLPCCQCSTCHKIFAFKSDLFAYLNKHPKCKTKPKSRDFVPTAREVKHDPHAFTHEYDGVKIPTAMYSKTVPDTYLSTYSRASTKPSRSTCGDSTLLAAMEDAT